MSLQQWAANGWLRSHQTTAAQIADLLTIVDRDIARTPLLEPAEETSLARRAKSGDDSARSRMIRANLRLVVHIARNYAGWGLPTEDLVAEGNIGLLKAVERFDPELGTRFSTYAAWWIKQAMTRALQNQSRTIRVPAHTLDKHAKVRRIAAALARELGREPSDEELADEAGLLTEVWRIASPATSRSAHSRRLPPANTRHLPSGPRAMSDCLCRINTSSGSHRPSRFQRARMDSTNSRVPSCAVAACTSGGGLPAGGRPCQARRPRQRWPGGGCPAGSATAAA